MANRVGSQSNLNFRTANLENMTVSSIIATISITPAFTTSPGLTLIYDPTGDRLILVAAKTTNPSFVIYFEVDLANSSVTEIARWDYVGSEWDDFTVTLHAGVFYFHTHWGERRGAFLHPRTR